MPILFKNTLLTAFIASFVLLTSSCSSMFGDNSRQVVVKSQPSGANIYVGNQYMGTTPAIITLPTYIYGGEIISLKKRGYQEQVAVIGTQFQYVGLWNLLNGIGFIIDGVTGDFVKIDPQDLNIDAAMNKQ